MAGGTGCISRRSALAWAGGGVRKPEGRPVGRALAGWATAVCPGSALDGRGTGAGRPKNAYSPGHLKKNMHLPVILKKHAGHLKKNMHLPVILKNMPVSLTAEYPKNAFGEKTNLTFKFFKVLTNVKMLNYRQRVYMGAELEVQQIGSTAMPLPRSPQFKGELTRERESLQGKALW